jgi:hypothetical protein
MCAIHIRLSMRPCTPNSDSNAPGPGYPGGGAGFVEMQLYPPGYAPFVDSISCDDTHWCAALNFEPEYTSAAANNVIPWGPGPYMIDTQFEIGHFEPCQSVTGAQQFTQDVFTDTYFTNCSRPYEVGAEHPDLEGDDSPCYHKGDTHGGRRRTRSRDATCSSARLATSTTTARRTTRIGPPRPRPGGSRRRSSRLSRPAPDTDMNISSSRPTSPRPSTGQTFGGDTQYGPITFNPPGAFTNAIQPNPTSCPSSAGGT